MSTGESAPYGIFVDNSYRMTFDMGKSKDDEYFWRAEGGSNNSDGSYTDSVTGDSSISQTVDNELAEKARTDRESLLQHIDAEYNTLQTITVLGKEKPEGSAISALQPSEDASEFPYIKLRSSPSAIVLRGWTPTDLSLYVPNGHVSVEVKGTNGGERLEIGFEEMKNGQSVSVTKNLDTEIIDEWQSVTIPLSEIALW